MAPKAKAPAAKAKAPAAKAKAVVPESLLKKRQRDEKWALEKTEKAAVAKKEAKDKRKVIFKKAEAYVKEYRAQVRCTRPDNFDVSVA